MAYSDGVAISHELFLRIEDGSKRWEKPKLDNPLCIEIEEEHRLICTSYNKVFCFDVRSGEMIWKNQIEDLFVSKVIKEDNQIILGTEKGWIYCIESTYGTIQWKIQVCHTIDCLPMIYNKCLFISGGKTDPSVSCFDMTEGTRLWTYRIDSQGTSSPYVTNGKVYVGAHERKHPWGFSYHDLYCLDANNGELVWKYNTKSLIWSRPVVENNNIYFSSLDKSIYRINENTLINDNFYKNRK